jgi:aminotransferase
VQEILPRYVNRDTTIADREERRRMSSIRQSALVEHVISKRARDVGDGFPTQTSVPTPGLITLSGGTPDFPTPAHVIEAAKRALDQSQTTYTPWTGLPELRAAIAEKLERDNGITADPDSEILVTTGTQEAIQVICKTLLDPGDELLIHAPYYDEYRRDALIAGGRLVAVPTREEDNFAIDLDALAARITPRTKGIIVVSPSNPSGAVQSLQALTGVAALAERHNLVVVADELYEKFVYEEHRHHSIAAFPHLWERTITINGFSKCFSMTGFRVGYIVAPAPFIRAMLPIKHGMTICAPSVSQWAALAALKGPQEWFKDILEEYDRRRRLWIDYLRRIGLTFGYPQGAYYIYFNTSTVGLTGAEFARRLRQDHGVIIGSGGKIGADWRHYLRGSLAVPQDALRTGLERLGAAVAELKRASGKSAPTRGAGQ